MRLRRRHALVLLPVALAAASVIVNASTGAQASGRLANTSHAMRDLTLSFDASPPYSEWWGIQPGYRCINGAIDQSQPRKPPSAAFVRDASPGNVRHGTYSAKVVLRAGDHASHTCKAEAVLALKRLGEREGTESWWGWSWKLPVGWRGTSSWGELIGFTTNRFFWPSYGMLDFDAGARNSLRLVLHTGLTPNPGAPDYDAEYREDVTLLGPRAPRPMVYGKWLDFYMHVVWRSHASGVLQIWYRVAGQARFTKLYSDVPGEHALLQARPHPTLLYNAQNGAPGENGKPGLVLEGGLYRGNARWSNTYWWDGMRRRRSRAAILRGFSAHTSARRAPRR